MKSIHYKINDTCHFFAMLLRGSETISTTNTQICAIYPGLAILTCNFKTESIYLSCYHEALRTTRILIKSVMSFLTYILCIIQDVAECIIFVHVNLWGKNVASNCMSQFLKKFSKTMEKTCLLDTTVLDVIEISITHTTATVNPGTRDAFTSDIVSLSLIISRRMYEQEEIIRITGNGS